MIENCNASQNGCDHIPPLFALQHGHLVRLPIPKLVIARLFDPPIATRTIATRKKKIVYHFFTIFIILFVGTMLHSKDAAHQTRVASKPDVDHAPVVRRQARARVRVHAPFENDNFASTFFR